MRRVIVIVGAALATAAVVASGGAQTPVERPFPSAKVSEVFVAAQTVTAPGSTLGAGALSNYFARGSTVVFRAFAATLKTGNILTDKDVKYFYVQIPGAPSLKLAYRGQFKSSDPVARWPWTASWTVPADYPLGIVQFKVLLQTKTKQLGSFVQLPVVTSQLTVTK